MYFRAKKHFEKQLIPHSQTSFKFIFFLFILDAKYQIYPQNPLIGLEQFLP
jgi:hypothetical protein